MKVASLFSGIGGADLGFERAGHEVVFQCELDKHARGILKRHWPNVQTMEDIRDVRGRDLPEFDVLVGGFPCQDLSVAGRRAGLAGERSGLFHEFARIAGGGLNGQDAYTGRIIARHRVRRLTPLECERVMGFPDGWTDRQADSHRYKQLGNAIVPNVAEWIAARIGKAHLAAGLEAVQ